MVVPSSARLKCAFSEKSRRSLADSVLAYYTQGPSSNPRLDIKMKI